jgi:hypothetical protein
MLATTWVLSALALASPETVFCRTHRRTVAFANQSLFQQQSGSVSQREALTYWPGGECREPLLRSAMAMEWREGDLLGGQEDGETCAGTTRPACAPNAY